MTSPVTAGSGKSCEPEGRGAAWTEERATKERATRECGASGAPRRRAANTAPPGEGPPGAARVLAALDAVRDPELDEPITALGFVASCTVSADGDAQARLRLPTYFCAPNFAFLMVADAYDAMSAVP